jgi:branched-chain amino acid transport system substrate-binding protein
MKAKLFITVACLVAIFLAIGPWSQALAGKPIIIGAPLSTAYLYGWDAERGIKLAIEEINAQGGVNVGGEKRPFQVEVIDTRDLEPGVPVSEALLAVEKLILDKKSRFPSGRAGPL